MKASLTLLSLWLLTAAAIFPVVAQEKLCPTVTLECVSQDYCRSPLRFVARVSNVPSQRVSYKWAISAGKLLKGQGTPAITVASKPGESLTATLEIFGPDTVCPRVASITIICDPPPPVRLFGEFEVVSGLIDKSHLDRFARQLNNEPSSRGYVVVYGKRSSGDNAKGYLVANGNIEADRLVLVTQKRRLKRATIKLYVVPAGANPPRG